MNGKVQTGVVRSVLSIPGGRVTVDEREGAVDAILFSPRPPVTGARGPVARRVANYLRGTREDFRGLEVRLDGFTPFERRVLETVRRIPYGETRTYGEVAAAVGRPGASRAVGNAVGKNTACLVVPCHRVVASNGIGGFGGGIRVKRFLLGLEGARPGPDSGF